MKNRLKIGQTGFIGFKIERLTLRVVLCLQLKYVPNLSEIGRKVRSLDGI